MGIATRFFTYPFITARSSEGPTPSPSLFRIENQNLPGADRVNKFIYLYKEEQAAKDVILIDQEIGGAFRVERKLLLPQTTLHSTADVVQCRKYCTGYRVSRWTFLIH